MQQITHLGNLPVNEADYDKLRVMVITVGPDGAKSENKLIRYLSLLLSNELPLESRKQQLEDEYRIEMTEDLAKEMNDVCNLGEGIARRSKAEGKAEGENLLATLMTKLKELGRIDDAFRAASDPEYRNSLYKEFQLA